MNIVLIAQALRALANALETPEGSVTADTVVPVAGKPRGRPARGEAVPTAAAPTASAPAAAVSPATTATQLGAAPPAATPAAAATAPNGAALTHALVAPTFTANAKQHGREFVVKCMKKFNAATFDKVPAAQLQAFKTMLEAGPQPETNVNDVEDLMG